MRLTARQTWVLVLLTLVWGLNWPVMKLGVSGTPAQPHTYPPLTFRALSMLGGLPVLAAALVLMKVSLRLPRAQIGPLLQLALTNMMIWHVVIISALPSAGAAFSSSAAIRPPAPPRFSTMTLAFSSSFILSASTRAASGSTPSLASVT